MKRRHITWSIFIATLVLSLIGSGTIAAAIYIDNMMPTATRPGSCRSATDPFDPNARVCRTDNSAVFYYSEQNGDLALESSERVIVRDVIRDKYEASTVLSVYYENPPDLTGVSETDIIYQEGPVPAGKVGFYWCDDRAGFSDECDQGYVRFTEISGTDSRVTRRVTPLDYFMATIPPHK